MTLVHELLVDWIGGHVFENSFLGRLSNLIVRIVQGQKNRPKTAGSNFSQPTRTLTPYLHIRFLGDAFNKN